MTKSLAYDFVGLFGAILKDIAIYHPDDQVMWNRDLETLAHLSQTRGQSTFTIDLPAIGKQLDRSLSDGTLSLSGNLTKTRKGTRIPELFQGLWSRLFDDSGVLKEKLIDPNDVFFLRTLMYVGKNLDWECSPRYLFEATKEFYDVEAALPPSSPVWDSGDRILVADLGHIRDLYLPRALRSLSGSYLPYYVEDFDSATADALCDSIQREADKIAAELGWFDPDEYSFKHGPGVVSDLSKGKYKYDFPSWDPRLEAIFPFDRFGVSQFGLMDRLQPDGIDVTLKEWHSKLIAVPKTQKGPRLIASEPTCHQWTQQCVRDFLYKRVESTYLGEVIRFNDQTANQEYARLGSLDGRYATIDLKSASDRLSTQLVQRIFRRNLILLEAMRDSRTRYLYNGIDKKQPSHHKLRKFSTQGSALTFPVQSIVFTAIALGVGRLHEPKTSTRNLCKKVRVFGDDIIVPREWVVDTIAALEGLYLKVNSHKSFWKGYFRESCGADMWKGHDVTPPHVTTRCVQSNPVSVASNVAVSNNFHKKGLWNAASWIKTSDMPGLIPVVDHGSGMFGFISFSGAKEPGRKRWNPRLHRYEVKVLAIIAKANHEKQNTPGAMLQYFTEDPPAYMDYESGVAIGGVPVFRYTWADVSQLGRISG